MRELATQCIDRQIAALSHLHAVVSTPEYARILEKVIAVAQDNYTRRVMIAGVGKNSNIASKISETMASLGIPSFYLNVSHCGHGDFGFIGHNDIIIHISRSGMTREMLEAMDHIRLIRPNVFQALIHCKKNKPQNLSASVELYIGTVAEGDEFELAPTTSTTALLCTLDTISVQASHAIGFKRLDFLKFHPDGALGDMLKSEQALSMSAAAPKGTGFRLPKELIGLEPQQFSQAVNASRELEKPVEASDISEAVEVQGTPIHDPNIAALVNAPAEVQALFGEKP